MNVLEVSGMTAQMKMEAWLTEYGMFPYPGSYCSSCSITGFEIVVTIYHCSLPAMYTDSRCLYCRYLCMHISDIIFLSSDQFVFTMHQLFPRTYLHINVDKIVVRQMMAMMMMHFHSFLLKVPWYWKYGLLKHFIFMCYLSKSSIKFWWEIIQNHLS